MLSLIQNELSPQAISKIGDTIGESPENTKSALGAAVPAVLGSLIGKANASPDGATQIFNALQQRPGERMDSLSSMVGGGAQAQPGAGSLLNTLFGSRLVPIAEFISGHAGIKSSSAMSLLGMAAPLVMGTLHKQVSSENLDAAGLGQLLNSQAGHLKEVMPTGLANTLGIGSLLSGAKDTTRVLTDAPLPAEASMPSAPEGPTPQRTGGGLKWAAALVLVGVLAFWALSKSNNPPASGGTADPTETQSGHSFKTPDLSFLKLPPGSTGDKMAKAISSGNWKQTFDLSDLSFDRSGRLEDSTTTDLKQIGSILEAAPNLNLSITGYGATQDEGAAKADSIKSALNTAGISSDRLITRGEIGSDVPKVRFMK